MNDPIDKVFDTTYYVYLQSSNAANNGLNYLKSKTIDIEQNVTSLVKTQFGLNPEPVPPIPKESWYEKNKYFFTTVAIGSSVALGYLLYNNNASYTSTSGGRNSASRRKRKVRRANKLYNGARYETILIIGNAMNPSIQRLINDLNQRGFIIYITVSSEAELRIIEAEDSIDIRPLAISYESVKTVKEAVSNFKTIISTPVLPFANADEHYLNLKSVLIIPDYNHFPKGLVEEIPTAEWERVINSQFLKITNLLYSGLLSVIRENNIQKKYIEKVNKVYTDDLEDSSDLDDEDYDSLDKNIGGDTKLIFINFINDLNNSMKNFHTPELISILLKDKLYDYLYQDIQYLSNFDIPQHSSAFKRIFYPKLKSPHYINISQLVINYSPSSSSVARSSDSVYISSVLESQYRLTPSSYHNQSFIWSMTSKIWKLFKDLFFFNERVQKISSTRLHHTIFDMIYSRKDLPKYQYLSSHGALYDYCRQALTY